MQKLFDLNGQNPWWRGIRGGDVPDYLGDPAGVEGTLPSPIMEPFVGGRVPKQPLGGGVSISPVNPYGGGTPTQQLGGSGGLRTQPGTAAPGGAGGISLNQGLAGLYAPGRFTAPNALQMDPRRMALLSQLYGRRRWGQPTTAPVGPAMPQNPTYIPPGTGY